jgi:hypothetical protein
MNRLEDRGRMGEDARFELSLAAMSHERRSRPRGILVIAVVALVGAIVFAGLGVSARSAARAEARRAIGDVAAVQMMAEELGRLDAAERDPGGSGGVRINNPNPLLLTRMEELARQAGLQTPRQPTERRPSSDQRPGIRVTHYHYGENPNQITHSSLEAMLEWLRLATGEELGMEIMGLNLKPDGNNWKLSVTFRRWERTG